MAKKETKKAEVAQPEIKATNEMVEVKIKEKPEPKKPVWEVKDRVYYLTQDRKPLSYMIKSAGIYWFDEEKQYERELKYCENQRTAWKIDENLFIFHAKVVILIHASCKSHYFDYTFMQKPLFW